MCQNLTSGEFQNQFETFISSCKTGSETNFQNQDLCNYRVYSLKDNGDPLVADYPYRSIAMMLPFSG